jgi:Transcriptional regulatory protein, C terminal
MGVVAKNPISKLMSVQGQQVSEFFPDDSATPIRIMHLKEALSLAQFVAVIVLAPEPVVTEGGPAPSQIAGSTALTDDPARSELGKLLSKTITRPKTGSSETDLVFGDANVSFSSMEASLKGEPVKLTAMEFKKLKYLAQNTRRVISRDELLNEVWGYENYPCTRTVDNHILRLRQKLEKDPSRPIHFRTVHGVGYKFLP